MNTGKELIKRKKRQRTEAKSLPFAGKSGKNKKEESEREGG